MHHLNRIILPAAVLLALAGCQASAPTPGPSTSSSSSTSANAANVADVMFTQMMIPHHEQAVTMSDLILAKQGIAADVTKLAASIKSAQQPEIDQMKTWLKAWGASEGGEHSGHAGMGGMLSQQQLDAIRDAQGVQAEKLFLTGMIAHHEGAVTMAKAVEVNGSSTDVKKLAATIISSQQAEIDQMETMLAARG